MTTGEKLDANSTVSNTTALEHLLNPSGTGGGGGDTIINSELIQITIDEGIKIFEREDKVGIIAVEDNVLILSDDVIEIKDEKVKINGTC